MTDEPLRKKVMEPLAPDRAELRRTDGLCAEVKIKQPTLHPTHIKILVKVVLKYKKRSIGRRVNAFGTAALQ